MLELATIRPASTATLTITVLASDVPVLGATLVGTFRSADGTVAHPGVVFRELTNGQYTTTILPAWTTVNGQPKPGRYLLDVQVTKDENVLLERYAIPVKF